MRARDGDARRRPEAGERRVTCSRCSAPLLNSTSTAGLCDTCLTGSSLSALVALAASQPIQPPICFVAETLTRDREWRAEQFARSETM